jgi:hypothetical protein
MPESGLMRCRLESIAFSEIDYPSRRRQPISTSPSKPSSLSPAQDATDATVLKTIRHLLKLYFLIAMRHGNRAALSARTRLVLSDEERNAVMVVCADFGWRRLDRLLPFRIERFVKAGRSWASNCSDSFVVPCNSASMCRCAQTGNRCLRCERLPPAAPGIFLGRIDSQC